MNEIALFLVEHCPEIKVIDPSNSAVYTYSPYAATTNNTVCTGYHLGGSLETGSTHTVLQTDADVTSTPAGYQVCNVVGATADFSGADSGKCNAGHIGTACFDARS